MSYLPKQTLNACQVSLLLFFLCSVLYSIFGGTRVNSESNKRKNINDSDNNMFSNYYKSAQTDEFWRKTHIRVILHTIIPHNNGVYLSEWPNYTDKLSNKNLNGQIVCTSLLCTQIPS